MSWRTIVISNRCKLDYKMGFMVIRAEETKRVYLDDISVIIIENTAVSITCVLINELIKKKVKLIFCDEHFDPCSELVPHYGSYDCSSKLKMQISWDEDIRGEVWTVIVREKIKNQMKLLEKADLSQAASKLGGYIDELEFYDETNREGHAAKVYFNALYGKDFSRNDDIPTNAALNYGYSIMLSMINREIAVNGYNTMLGIFHDNIFNQFNLGCDLVEPFRPLVDEFVYFRAFNLFGTEEKHEMLRLTEKQLIINGQKNFLPNAVKIYCRSVFDALNENDTTKIKFFEAEK